MCVQSECNIRNVNITEVLLTETEEQRVHTHGINAEETMGNEVGANHYGLVMTRETTQTLHLMKILFVDIVNSRNESTQTHQDGYPIVVEIRSCILKGLHSPREEKEGEDPCDGNTEDDSQFPCSKI